MTNELVNIQSNWGKRFSALYFILICIKYFDLIITSSHQRLDLKVDFPLKHFSAVLWSAGEG